MNNITPIDWQSVFAMGGVMAAQFFAVYWLIGEFNKDKQKGKAR